MALDVIFGQNDVFVLAWIVFALVAWQVSRQRARAGQNGTKWLMISSLSFGLACAAKPTAWFFAPFYGLLLVQGDARLAQRGWRGAASYARDPKASLARHRRLCAAAATLRPGRCRSYDDVRRWSSGQGPTGYQIWAGRQQFRARAGASDSPFCAVALLDSTDCGGRADVNLVCGASDAEQYVGDRLLALRVLFLLVFFYASRFLNENYLGYVLAFLAIGTLAGDNIDAIKRTGEGLPLACSFYCT